MALAHRTWADGMAVGYAYSPDRISVLLRDDSTIPFVLLADPVRSHLGRVKRARCPSPAFSTDPSRRLVHPYRWRRGEPTTMNEAVPVYRRLDRWLRAQVEATETVLVTSHPVLAAVADRGAWRDISYYAWDDFRGIPGFFDLYGWAHETLAAADVNVVGVTEKIVQNVGARRRTVVPNAILASDYDDVDSVPAWFTEVRGRVAFYAGSLQGRVDVDALTTLARDLGSDWTIVLVGPMQDPEWFRGLAAEPNVLIHEAEPRSSILAMMAAADVCLVPHLDGTGSMSPLKIYEYLGAGAAVVATDLEAMRGLSPRCLLVPAGGSLTPAVLEAAALPAATPEEVAAFRAEHDWSARYAAWRQSVLGY
ncbi:glycosyltransferase [Nocardioides sp. InS609-2]|uniref:glycosyltransferase n=1 Tax=Nocardioides sp. InS609-2 TaxID=2760705 RepID=UPI0020BDE8A0|nr:glycosyltransferase [Nocardioides sp. InS609-2]